MSDYSKKQDDRTAAWKAKDRAKAQEIGPLPAVKDQAEKDICQHDFGRFCKTYGGEMFGLPWSKNHLAAIEKMEAAVLRGGMFALAMPRGSGKTTLAEWLAIWAACYGHCRYIVIIGATEPAARKRLKSIKSVLRFSDELYADFPEACHPIRCLEGETRRASGQKLDGNPTEINWCAEQLTLATVPGAPCSGAIIEVVGITGDIRGRAHTLQDGSKIRPQLAIVDDPQTRESARSPKQCKDRKDTILGDVAYMAGPGESIAIVIPCTVIEAGDAADQFLDRDKYPELQGERTKLIESFPTAEKLWEEYAAIRSESLRSDGSGEEATEFYREHQAEMDAGAAVSWPERFNADKGEISAIQHAMNLKLRDEQSFFAEYQNAPIAGLMDAVELPSEDEIAAKVNGVKRGIVPAECTTLTAFVDISQKCLWWMVAGWSEDFTGSIIDYGVFPKQKTTYTTLATVKATLQSEAAKALNMRPGSLPGLEAFVKWGLDTLGAELLDREWHNEDGTPLKVSRLLIDANWGQSTKVVENYAQRSKFASIVFPSHGKGVTARDKPLCDIAGKPKRGERRGLHWRIFPPAGGGGIRFMYDTNYWKSFAFNRLALPVGDRGALSLFEAKPFAHKMLAEQLTAETCIKVSARGREVEEWKLLPHKHDEHFLDCLVGNAVAASSLGVALPGHKEQRKPPRRVKGGRKVSYME